MAKKTIVNEAIDAMRDVAGAALDAAADEARRVIAETVANTAARVEERAKDALPAVEGAVKERLVKPVDRALGAPSSARRKTAKTAARDVRTKTKKKKAKAARPATGKAARKKVARTKTSRKKVARKKAARKKQLGESSSPSGTTGARAAPVVVCTLALCQCRRAPPARQEPDHLGTTRA